MPTRGTDRVFRFHDRHAAAAVLALLSLASSVQSSQALSQDPQASFDNGEVVIQGTGLMGLMPQARQPLMRHQPVLISDSLDQQQDDDVAKEAVEVALEVEEASRAVQREEALEAMVEAAEEVGRQKVMEEAAEERLRLRRQALDEVSQEMPEEPAALTERKARPSEPSCLTCQCSFVDRQGAKSSCDATYALRLLIGKWLDTEASVIEVGAMYGATSCAIAKQQRNSGKLVAVEPDHRMWDSLEINRASNRCNFTTLRGLLGQEDMKAVETTDGAMQFVSVEGAGVNYAADVIVPHLSTTEVENRYKMKFNAAVVDCDGCFSHLVEQNRDLFPSLNMLIIDSQSQEDIEKLEKLKEMGKFQEVETVGSFRVLRRNCGTPQACAVPPKRP